MAAITPTKVVEIDKGAGNVKEIIFTATIGSASDTVALADYFDSLLGVVAVLEGGADAALLAGIQASFSGTTVTLVTQEQDGTASTEWTGANVRLFVTGIN